MNPQPGVEQPEDASRNGQVLVSVRETQSEVWNVQLLSLGGGPPPAAWPATRFSQTSPRLSPDGRWIAYASDESGDREIYVAATEGGAEKRRISSEGGRRPRWRADGKELFFLAPGGVVMAAEVRPGRVLVGRDSAAALSLGDGDRELGRDPRRHAIPGDDAPSRRLASRRST